MNDTESGNNSLDSKPAGIRGGVDMGESRTQVIKTLTKYRNLLDARYGNYWERSSDEEQEIADVQSLIDELEQGGNRGNR